MGKICTVSHPRSGIHWFLNTVSVNFKTPYSDYWDMFSSHKCNVDEVRTSKPEHTIMHLWRDIEKVLTSVWRMRERNGISIDYSFSDFLRTKYSDMPRLGIRKCKIFFDDKIVIQSAVSWIAQQPLTPPELWLKTVQYWIANADITMTYEQMQDEQDRAMDLVEEITGWKKLQRKVLQKTVGWHPKDNKEFLVSEPDKILIDGFRRKLAGKL